MLVPRKTNFKVKNRPQNTVIEKNGHNENGWVRWKIFARVFLRLGQQFLAPFLNIWIFHDI